MYLPNPATMTSKQVTMLATHCANQRESMVNQMDIARGIDVRTDWLDVQWQDWNARAAAAWDIAEAVAGREDDAYRARQTWFPMTADDCPCSQGYPSACALHEE